MSTRGIMSRIASGDTRSVDERESIVAHLQALLNARKGQSPIAPDYGIVDMVDMVHSFPNSLGELQSSIRETITKYEPRLKNVRVRYQENPENLLLLRFEITAQLTKLGSRGLLRFKTQVNSSGAFRVA